MCSHLKEKCIMENFVACFEIWALVSTDITDDIKRFGKKSRYAHLSGVQSYGSTPVFEADSPTQAHKIARELASPVCGCRNYLVFRVEDAVVE